MTPHAREEARRITRRRRQRHDSLRYLVILLCAVAAVAGVSFAILNYVGG